MSDYTDPKALAEFLTIRMTRGRAIELGLLACGNCGHPENNHFRWGDHPCAHCRDCPGYSENVRSGMILMK